MNVYEVFNFSEEYKIIDVKENSALFKYTIDAFDGSKIAVANCVESFKWLSVNGSTKICDFPFIMGSIPTISEKAFILLKPLLEECDIQVIHIIVEGLNYYVLNVMSLYDDVLNIKASKISYFNNGDIKNIVKYVFLPSVDKVSPFFKIKQLPTYTFITDEVVKIIDRNHLIGAEIEHCQIKKENIIQRLLF
jgi:hypothetical protein